MFKRFVGWLLSHMYVTRTATSTNLSSVTLVKDGVAKKVVYRNGVEVSRTITPAEEADVVAEIAKLEKEFSDILKEK